MLNLFQIYSIHNSFLFLLNILFLIFSEQGGGAQLSFFQLDDPVLIQIRDEILNADINNLTPLEALNKLNEIKKIVGGNN